MEGQPRAPHEPPRHATAAAVPPAHPSPEPSFVTVPTWRWRVYLHPGVWLLSIVTMIACVLTALIGIGLVIAAGSLIGGWAAGPWDAVTWAAAIACWVAIVAACGLAMRSAVHWSGRRSAASFESTIPRSEPARGFMLAELRESGPPKDGWSTWRARRWVEEVRRHSAARIYLTRRLEERTAQFDRTDRPVEPERIGGSAGTSGMSIVLYGGLAAYFLWRGGTRSPLPWMFCVLGALALFRLLRRRALFAPVVAGQGWIQHGDARWTVNDSVIVASGRANARVRVIGPRGVLTLQLPTARGNDFESLWMRWMHPHPALEQRAFDA